MCFLFFLTLIAYIRDRKDKIVPMLKWHILTGTFVSLVGIAQFILFFLGWGNGVIYRYWSLAPQVLGTANEPGPFAGYLITTLLVGFIAYNERKLFPKKILFTLVSFQFLALLLTFSSAGWIISIIVVGLYFLKRSVLSLFKWGMIAIVAVAIIFSSVLLIWNVDISPAANFVFSRTFTIVFYDPSKAYEGGRISGKSLCFNMFKASPLLGVGIGNFPFYRNEFLEPQGIPFIKGGPDLPANVYFEVLAETGIVGFTFFMLFLISILKITFNDFKYLDKPLKSYGNMVAYPSIGVMINLFFNSILGILYVWFLPAILIAIVSGKNSDAFNNSIKEG
jgi:O-antigen ligase